MAYVMSGMIMSMYGGEEKRNESEALCPAVLAIAVYHLYVMYIHVYYNFACMCVCSTLFLVIS